MRVYNTITKTYPIHIHQNGNPKRLEKNGIARKVFAALKPKKCFETPGIIVVTWSTRRDTVLEKNLELFGMRPIILTKKHWTNRAKSQLAFSFLKTALPGTYCFSDAWDAMFMEHPNRLLSAGNLISGEKGLGYPLDCPVPLGTGYAPGGNSGGVVGDRNTLLELYAEALKHTSKEKPKSDQYGVRIAAHKLGIPVDENCQFFQTLSWIEKDEICLLDAEA